MSIRITGFAGSLSRPSKTRALVDYAARRAAGALGAAAEVRVFDLADLQPHLGAAARLADLPPGPRAVVDAIIGADLLIVGSPVYKGSYAGLFKHLFDLIEPADLAGKPVLLTATGGGEKHALVIEHQLRPLFAFFEAAVAPTGIYAGPSDFTDGLPASAPLLARLDRGLAQLAATPAQRAASRAA